MSMLTQRGVQSSVRRRRRARVRRPLLVLLVIAALAASGYWFLVLRDGPATRAAPAPIRSCPAPVPTPALVPTGQVKVNVYNATGRRGLAATVATALRRRGFKVADVANDPAKRAVTGVAEVRSSTAGAGAARTVGAQVFEFVSVPDKRADASVDLVLGASFKALRSPARATAALHPSPAPRPAGC